AISLGDLLSLARTRGRSESFEGEAGEITSLQQTDCDAGRSRGDVLRGRRLPPAVSGKARIDKLPHLIKILKSKRACRKQALYFLRIYCVCRVAVGAGAPGSA